MLSLSNSNNSLKLEALYFSFGCSFYFLVHYFLGSAPEVASQGSYFSYCSYFSYDAWDTSVINTSFPLYLFFFLVQHLSLHPLPRCSHVRSLLHRSSYKCRVSLRTSRGPSGRPSSPAREELMWRVKLRWRRHQGGKAQATLVEYSIILG